MVLQVSYTIVPKQDDKKVLAFLSAFIADCQKRTLEFREEFEEAGGEVWDLVPSLNASPTWVECLEDLVKQATPQVEPALS